MRPIDNTGNMSWSDRQKINVRRDETDGETGFLEGLNGVAEDAVLGIGHSLASFVGGMESFSTVVADLASPVDKSKPVSNYTHELSGNPGVITTAADGSRTVSSHMPVSNFLHDKLDDLDAIWAPEAQTKGWQAAQGVAETVGDSAVPFALSMIPGAGNLAAAAYRTVQTAGDVNRQAHEEGRIASAGEVALPTVASGIINFGLGLAGDKAKTKKTNVFEAKATEAKGALETATKNLSAFKRQFKKTAIKQQSYPGLRNAKNNAEINYLKKAAMAAIGSPQVRAVNGFVNMGEEVTEQEINNWQTGKPWYEGLSTTIPASLILGIFDPN